MDYVTLALHLISGALGGNIAGALFRNLSLGVVGNSLAGVVGGGLGGQLLTALLGLPPAWVAEGAIEPTAILGQIASGGIGGAVVMIVVAALKGVFAK
jgi:hypothetical protein